MHIKDQHRSPRFGGLCAAVLLAVTVAQRAQAQNYTVIHTFTGGSDGARPAAGLTIDKAGSLYGTTSAGSFGKCTTPPTGCGTVFELTQTGSGWALTPLYSFQGGNDGAHPVARVVLGPGGIYGTTVSGGEGTCQFGYDLGCGTVFHLTPPLVAACKKAFCPWPEKVLYRFSGYGDGSEPEADLVFDQAGKNIYGTTSIGGLGHGTVYELIPLNGSWTESVPYSFSGGSDGGLVTGGVILDSAGNLYGTTFQGGAPGCQLGKGCGTVFELTPSNGGWTETVLYTFQGGNDGGNPGQGLIFDQFGSLYGGSSYSNGSNLGTIFKLTPSNDGWAFTLIYKFQRGSPAGESLTMDASGNLYGTTQTGGAYGQGSVYKLTPSGDGWTYTSLHDFTGGSDGGGPLGSVTLDISGNLYGTAYGGGSNFGVVWEITP